MGVRRYGDTAGQQVYEIGLGLPYGKKREGKKIDYYTICEIEIKSSRFTIHDMREVFI